MITTMICESCRKPIKQYTYTAGCEVPNFEEDYWCSCGDPKITKQTFQ
jgi:hypothetical protein